MTPSHNGVCGLRPLAAALVLGAVMLVASAPGLRAADTGFSSYVTPFPPNERHKLFVFGDSLAAGLAAPLAADLAASNVDVVNKAIGTPGLSRTDAEWEKIVEALPLGDDFQIAVVLVGADDRGPIRLPKQRLDFGTPAWKQDYERRIDGLLKALHSRKAAVYWVGLPIMRGEVATNAAQLLNGMFLERARLSSTKFVDIWDGFVDADGAYSDIGPDLTGAVRQLRTQNGVYMTALGYQKLANILEREITHDLTAAHREREVPLAGDEPEQQNVRDDALPRSATADGKADAKAAKAKALKDVAADDGVVTLTSPADAPPDVVAIIRPPISGSVIAQILSSRAALQADLGHTMSADLLGGFTALSSISTSADAKENLRQQLPLTDSPFYRLLIRGDTLPAKPGRVDDFGWPRAGAAAPAEEPAPGTNG